MFSVAQGVLIKLKCTLTAQENSKRYVFRKKKTFTLFYHLNIILLGPFIFYSTVVEN